MKFEGGYDGMSAEAQMSLAPSHLVNFTQAVPDSAGAAMPDGRNFFCFLTCYTAPGRLG